MTWADVAGQSPWLTFFVIMCALHMLGITCIRLIRAANISKHGWPQAPMDADGDVRRL